MKLKKEWEKEQEEVEEVLRKLKTEYNLPQMSEEELTKLRGRMEEAKRENRRERGRARRHRAAMAAAIAAAAFVILPNTSQAAADAMERMPVIGGLVRVVTLRSYQYEDDRHEANLEIPELEIARQAGDAKLQNKLEETARELNGEIREIADKLLAEFMENVREETGYLDLEVKSELLAATEDYFALKLICYQASASGYEWNYYYVVDLHTGERLRLKDLFVDNSDYIARISDNIKEQMRRQMAENEEKVYWIDSEFADMDFETITEEALFYLNERGNVVIGFNEGDAAPMYMGALEFEIPAEVLRDIRKK